MCTVNNLILVFLLFYRYFTGHTCCIYLSGYFSSCTVPFSGCFSFFRVLFLSLKKYHGQRSSNGLGSEIHILRKSICFRQGYGCYDAIEVKLNLDIRELNGCRHLKTIFYCVSRKKEREGGQFWSPLKKNPKFLIFTW